MTDELFWALIEAARNGAEASASPRSMREVLRQLSNEEVLDFGRHFREKQCDLNSWKLWGAGYVIAGGMSDDSFHYFRSWIIGKGKAVFDLALKSPDNLGPYVDNPEVENESLEYAAVYEAQERGLDDPRDRSSRNPDGDPSGEPFEEDTVAAQFPKLAAQFL